MSSRSFSSFFLISSYAISDTRAISESLCSYVYIHVRSLERLPLYEYTYLRNEMRHLNTLKYFLYVYKFWIHYALISTDKQVLKHMINMKLNTIPFAYYCVYDVAAVSYQMITHDPCDHAHHA